MLTRSRAIIVAGALLAAACSNDGAADDVPDVPDAPAASDVSDLERITEVVCGDTYDELEDMAERLPSSGGEVDVIPFEARTCTHEGEQAIIEVYKNQAQQVRLLTQIGFAHSFTPILASLSDLPYVCGDYWSVVVVEMDTRNVLLEELDGMPCN